jgi:hypothetical protein
MVWTSNKLVIEREIPSSPNVKPGKVLPSVTAEVMKQFFFASDDISRIMPGTKDHVSVNSEGKVCLQQELILSNLKEVYLVFKEQNVKKWLDFSKFAESQKTMCWLE